MISSCSEEKSSSGSTTDTQEQKQVVIDRFFPEEIEEIFEDTVINDSITLRILIKSSDKDFLSTSLKLNTDTMFVDNYRNNNVQLDLSVHQKNVLSKLFNKQILAETMPKEFMENSKIILVSYHSFDPHKQEVKLRMNVCYPESDYCYLYSIYLTTSGRFKVEMEEVL